MSKRTPIARSPHRLDPLIETGMKLCPALSMSGLRRAAEMAQAMREAAQNHGGCDRDHLLAAGFTAGEVAAAHVLAEAILRTADRDLPDEAVAPFSLRDAGVLRRFAAREAKHARALQMAA